MNRGDRLVFSNGIVVLALVSSLMIYAFDREPDATIQMYRHRRVHIVHSRRAGWSSIG